MPTNSINITRTRPPQITPRCSCGEPVSPESAELVWNGVVDGHMDLLLTCDECGMVRNAFVLVNDFVPVE